MINLKQKKGVKMSVGPTPPNEWSNITSDLEKASQEAKTPDELNKKIHDIFQKNRLPGGYVLDETIRKRLRAIDDNTRLPFREILAANTLFQYAENRDSENLQGLERKFKILKDTYPDEFGEIIRSFKEKNGIQSDIQSFKELITNFYLKIPNQTIKDILGTASTGWYDINKLENEFFSVVYMPLVRNKARKNQSKEKVGLRDQSREIQERFLEGKSNQIRSVKHQYLGKTSFKDIFQDSCKWRSDLAFICLDPDVHLFGRLRNSSRGTGGGLISGFEASKAPPELLEKCEALIKKETNVGDDWPFPEGFQTRLSQRTIYGEIDHQKIPLTRLNILGKDENEFKQISRDYEGRLRTFPGLMHRHSWTHTEPQYINQCMSHIDALYQKLLNATSPDQKLNLIARIHWWGCQACPCARGSAAIMEVICQGLLVGS
ncbi:MAG: hypothetical protein FJZ60_03265, partial [Chlamydiae bacterium]|nr:hypothetical protein [Chlamydiota bacterium]